MKNCDDKERSLASAAFGYLQLVKNCGLAGIVQAHNNDFVLWKAKEDTTNSLTVTSKRGLSAGDWPMHDSNINSAKSSVLKMSSDVKVRRVIQTTDWV